MSYEPIDASDEATGLPPFRDTPDTEALLVMKGQVASQGLVMLPSSDTVSEPVPVTYLAVRGLVQGTSQGDVDWAQMLLAIPDQLLPQIVAQLGSALPPA